MMKDERFSAKLYSRFDKGFSKRKSERDNADWYDEYLSLVYLDWG